MTVLQGARRRRGNPEQKLQQALVRFLSVALPPRSVMFAVPNEGKRSKIGGANMRRAGLVSGVADLIILADGIAVALELKATTDLTANQIEFRDKWQAACGRWAVIRTVEQAEDALRSFGIPLRATVQPLKYRPLATTGDPIDYRPAAASAGTAGSAL